MKKSILLALSLSAACFSASAAESNLGYTSVEIGLAQQNLNTGFSTTRTTDTSYFHTSVSDTRLKGGYLNGSIELGALPLYAFGSYAQGKGHYDYNSEYVSPWYTNSYHRRTDVTGKEYSAGLGYYYGFNPNMNLIAELAYVHQRSAYDVEGYDWSNKADGGRLSVGYDALWGKHVETWIKANYVDMEHADRVFSGTVGMQYKITPMWGITGQGEFADGSNTYKLGVRASF